MRCVNKWTSILGIAFQSSWQGYIMIYCLQLKLRVWKGFLFETIWTWTCPYSLGMFCPKPPDHVVAATIALHNTWLRMIAVQCSSEKTSSPLELTQDTIGIHKIPCLDMSWWSQCPPGLKQESCARELETVLPCPSWNTMSSLQGWTICFVPSQLHLDSQDNVVHCDWSRLRCDPRNCYWMHMMILARGTEEFKLL